jgi:anthranilate synthase component 1
MGMMKELSYHVETVDRELDSCQYYLQQSLHGTKPYTLFYSIQDPSSPYHQLDLGLTEASLLIRGKQNAFELIAFDPVGQYLIEVLKDNLSAVIHDAEFTSTHLQGKIVSDTTNPCHPQRLAGLNHTVLLQALLDLLPAHSIPRLPSGLYGVFGHHFMEQLESIPRQKTDLLADPDYCFLIAKDLFVVDHQQQKTHFIRCDFADQPVSSTVPTNEHTLNSTDNATEFKGLSPTTSFVSDMDYSHFQQCFNNIQQHLRDGDVFQLVLSRMKYAPYHGDPFTVFKQLTIINPSPFQFYFHDGLGVLCGASPELCLRVRQKNDYRQLEITPIAGTKPYQRNNPHLNERHRLNLQIDHKEVAEHVMLIDLARNDIASIAETGTTLVKESLTIHEFSHVQHLVSRVVGRLSSSITALQAYLACMNMGTLTGAPKLRASELLQHYEATERGYFGGAIGFINSDDTLETAIVIRSLRFKNNQVYCRAGAGIVLDSQCEAEFRETEQKMAAGIQALSEVATHD